MRHPPEDQLKAFSDAELKNDELTRMQAHLAVCPACRARAAELQRRAEWVGARLSASRPALSSREQAHSRLLARIDQQKMEERPMLKKLMRKPAWIGLTVVLVLVLSLALPPVRAFATGFLKIFRVQQIQVIPVDVGMLDERAGDSSLNFEELFSDSVSVENKGERQTASSAAEASDLAGFNVREPAESDAESEIVVQPGASGSFTLNVERINLLLEELGQEDARISSDLDGAVVEFEVPPMVATAFGDCEIETPAHFDPDAHPELPKELPTSDCLVLMQIPSPTVSAPDGLDMDSLGEAFFRITGMSDDEARELSQKIDWSTTLVLPIPTQEATVTDVDVDGVQGTLIEQNDGQPYEHYVLTWVNDGRLYAITGDGDSEEAVELADSLE